MISAGPGDVKAIADEREEYAMQFEIPVNYSEINHKIEGANASMTCYLLAAPEEIPAQMEKPMVLVCPGGGYAYRSARESEPIAMHLLAAGFHVAIVNYSVAPHRFPTSALELAWCIREVRRHAAEWHVKPDSISVMGFSAGGHLACTLGTIWHDPLFTDALGGDAEEWKPNAQVLCYPVITMGEFTHEGSRENLLGENPDEGMATELSFENRVRHYTVPTFIWHTVEDGSVPVENSLQYARKLRKHGISFEMHLYEVGGHGLATCDARSATWPGHIQPDDANWIDMAVRFLRRHVK